MLVVLTLSAYFIFFLPELLVAIAPITKHVACSTSKNDGLMIKVV